ncbi:hypothetical protein HYFRA_00010404 [Hymenoscyphus fraxineus]|uniref:Uncharacterized protein n=1 Tax=Hymenoscyphus fraxineus TaxID=746836 RepID=A0A9N9L3L6_9HELO|nr:hypothetical protein HYFRA_00010404 [Hymenoscyphus fraxineus]
MHLYPKQSRQFRPGLTSSCKPPTPVSQTLLTFGRDDVVKRQSDGLGQALLTPHQNGSAKAHRSTFSPGTYNVTCSSYNPFYSHPKFKEEVPTYIQIIRNKTHLQPEKIPNLQPPYPKRCWSTLATITSSIGCLLLLKQRLLSSPKGTSGAGMANSGVLLWQRFRGSSGYCTSEYSTVERSRGSGGSGMSKSESKDIPWVIRRSVNVVCGSVFPTKMELSSKDLQRDFGAEELNAQCNGGDAITLFGSFTVFLRELLSRYRCV